MLLFMKYCLMLLIVTVARATLHIDKMEMCDKKSYPFTYVVKLKDSGTNQILEHGFLDAKMPLNNDIMSKVSIYQLDGKDWNLLITKSDPVCIMIDNFIGEFITGLEKSSGLKQTCPYPKGKIEVKDYPLDFSNFKYKDFPPGTVKIKLEYFAKGDVEEKKSLGCFNTQFTLL